MEAIGILLLLGLVGLIFALPIIAVVRAVGAARLARQNRDHAQKLTERVHALETQLKALEGQLKAQSVVREGAREGLGAGVAQVKPAATAPAGHSVPVPPPVAAAGAEVPPAAPMKPSFPSGAAPVATPATIPAAPPPPTVTKPVPHPGEGATAHVPAGSGHPASRTVSTPPVAAPKFEILTAHPPAHPPAARETARRALNLEEVLGTDWLNKIGMSILVIGVALFLAYEMRELGPAGKVLVGLAASVALLGGGIFYERRERYRLLARVAIGGGWALTFFTTYAMYHVGAARVLDSQALDLVLLLAVAAAMVAHTLRYNSQAVTGLALLLAFTTVTISKSNVYSLAAGAILALALVVIVHRRRWFELEVCGILASYFNHFYWLRPIIEPMRGHRHPFPEFYGSAGLLVFYWLVFRASYLLRRIHPPAATPALTEAWSQTSRHEENVSTVAALLNTFLLLGVMKYQSAHPEWAFGFLLLLGGVEFVLGQLPVARRRRPAFVLLSVVGATLMLAAIPFKYSGETLPMLWLAEAEALFLAGVFLEEIVFCRLGLLAGLLVAVQLDRFALQQLFDEEWKGFHAGERLRGIVQFSLASGIFYADAHWLARKYKRLEELRFDHALLQLISYAAAITASVGIWWLAPEMYVAVGFAALALGLIMLGRSTAIRDFAYQSHALAFTAFLRALTVNLGDQNIHHHLTVRLVSVALTVAGIYAVAQLARHNEEWTFKHASSLHRWCATLTLTLLAWYELKPQDVAVAWALLGLVAAIIGTRWKLRDFVYQSHGLAFLAFFCVPATTLGDADVHRHLAARLLSIGVTAVLLYATARWSGMAQAQPLRRISTVHTWSGSLLVGLLAWYELEPVSVALAWTLFGLVLFEISRVRRLPQLRWQAYLAFAASFARLFFVNFNATGTPGMLSPRFYTTVPLACAFFYVYTALDSAEADDAFGLERRWKAAEILCFMGTFTLAGWARFELDADWVVAAWAAMVWALAAIAWRFRKRIFLHQALLLGVAVLLRATLHNFYQRSYFPAPFWQGRWVTVGSTVVLLFATLPFALKLRGVGSEESGKGSLWRKAFAAFGRRPDQVFFFIPFFLLTVLLALEVRRGMVTMAWGLEAVAVFLVALAVGQRSYRLSALGLLLLCVGKIVVFDVWDLSPRDRYLTFIALGMALLGVSFLYTRFRETIRQFL